MSKATAPLAPAILHSVFLSIGIVITGYFLAAAVMESRREDRTVTTVASAEKTFATHPDSQEGLDDAESALLLQALRKGRLQANRFAEDSGHALGAVKSAKQGPVIWQISGDDRSSTASATVTLEYLLK